MGTEPLCALLDALPAVVCVHRDGHVLHANPSFLKALGRSDLATLTGERLEDLVDEGDRSHIAARSASTGASPSTLPGAELRWLRLDGSAVRLQTFAARMPFDGAIATVELGPAPPPAPGSGAHEVTSPSFGNQLAMVASLATGVAHEITNPLTYVLANLDILRDMLQIHGSKLPRAVVDEMDEIAAEAKTGADRVARIAHGLKIFAHVEDDVRTAKEVHPIVDAACALASNEIRHRARLVKIYRPLPRIEASEARLTLVFYNLFLNAARALHEGHAEENQIQVKTWTERDCAVVEIRDTGNGASPEQLSRIFEPAFSARPTGWGTDLGLALCHEIVASLGGQIAVEATLGLGSAVRVTLPAYAGKSLPPPPVTRITSSSEGSGKILVVDDDAAICTAIQRTLGRKHKVMTTTIGREVIDRVTGGERFDLILCDLMMPTLTGMEIYEAVRRVAPEQAERMVFMTGGAFTAASREFLQRVPNERFEKPFDGGRLRMLAKEMVLGIQPKP